MPVSTPLDTPFQLVATSLPSVHAGAVQVAFPAPGPPILSFVGISVRFGGVVALDDVSFDVERGSICGLIGPNGAGKTTLFNCLSRMYAPASGSILFDGHPIDALPRSSMARLGVGRTFQNLALFDSMSVRRNILVGTHCRSRGGLLAEALQLPFIRRDEREQRDRVEELIDLLELDDVADSPVRVLPFATKKRVEMARALAAKPRLLLLDEPAAGLNHEGVGHLLDLIRLVRDRLGITVLLVEHHLNLVMRVSDKVVVLNFGKKICDGIPSVVQTDPEVIRSYLGSSTPA